MSDEVDQDPQRKQGREGAVAPAPARQAPAERKDEHSWSSYSALLFLTYNSGLAAYRSIGDPWMVGFVVGSYVDLISLLYFLRVLERTPEGSPKRGPLKAVVWSLATVLTAMFSHRVADLMPWPVQLVIWGMAAATIIGGFYAYFMYQEKGSPKAKQL